MATNESWLLSLVIFLPLVGAIVIGFSPTRWARQLALVASLATWVASLVLADFWLLNLARPHSA